MCSEYLHPQNITTPSYKWVRDSSNSNLQYLETATEIPRQTIMQRKNKAIYLYLYRNEITYQNNKIEVILTNRYNVQSSPLFIDSIFFETTEQIQATIGIEGLGKLQRIVQSKRKSLTKNELDELARNFANCDC